MNLRGVRRRPIARAVLLKLRSNSFVSSLRVFLLQHSGRRANTLLAQEISPPEDYAEHHSVRT